MCNVCLPVPGQLEDTLSSRFFVRHTMIFQYLALPLSGGSPHQMKMQKKQNRVAFDSETQPEVNSLKIVKQFIISLIDKYSIEKGFS